MKGFKKCCISIATDKTDDMLWKGRNEDGNVRGECKEDDDTACKYAHSDTNW
jgi:hypothetical protein